MKILVETSGGGGVVLIVVAALLAGHSGGIGAALAAMLIALAVVVALALGGLAAFLVHRARREVRPRFITQLPAESLPARQLTASAAPALEAPREMRLHPEQLAELAEILRRQQAAE